MESLFWENEFPMLKFTFMDREAILIFPPKGVEKTDKWVLKTEYFDAFPDTEREMLRRGWHRAYLKARERCGTRQELLIKLAFADYLEKNYGLSHRFVPIGMSCGGLQAIKLAALAPERISVLYLDAPVVSFMSWPFNLGAYPVIAGEREQNELLSAYKMTRAEFFLTFRDHPYDHIPTLVQNRIPIIMVYGDSDASVPYEDNGRLIERAYRAENLPFFDFCKKGCDHHPHGLADPTPIADLIVRYGA